MPDQDAVITEPREEHGGPNAIRWLGEEKRLPRIGRRRAEVIRGAVPYEGGSGG